MPITRHTPLHVKQTRAGKFEGHRTLEDIVEGTDQDRYNRTVRAAKPYSKWYGTQEWKDLRAAHRKRFPDCARCGAPMRIVDHIKDHKGNKRLFLDPANLQSLCQHCHNLKTAQRDKPDTAPAIKWNRR